MNNAKGSMNLKPEQKNTTTRSTTSPTADICLCWGFTAQSTRQGHVERGQFT